MSGFIDPSSDQQRYDRLVEEAEIAATEVDAHMTDEERERFIEDFIELSLRP